MSESYMRWCFLCVCARHRERRLNDRSSSLGDETVSQSDLMKEFSALQAEVADRTLLMKELPSKIKAVIDDVCTLEQLMLSKKSYENLEPREKDLLRLVRVTAALFNTSSEERDDAIARVIDKKVAAHASLTALMQALQKANDEAQSRMNELMPKHKHVQTVQSQRSGSDGSARTSSSGASKATEAELSAARAETRVNTRARTIGTCAVDERFTNNSSWGFGGHVMHMDEHEHVLYKPACKWLVDHIRGLLFCVAKKGTDGWRVEAYANHNVPSRRLMAAGSLDTALVHTNDCDDPSFQPFEEQTEGADLRGNICNGELDRAHLCIFVARGVHKYSVSLGEGRSVNGIPDLLIARRNPNAGVQCTLDDVIASIEVKKTTTYDDPASKRQAEVVIYSRELPAPFVSVRTDCERFTFYYIVEVNGDRCCHEVEYEDREQALTALIRYCDWAAHPADAPNVPECPFNPSPVAENNAVASNQASPSGGSGASNSEDASEGGEGSDFTAPLGSGEDVKDRSEVQERQARNRGQQSYYESPLTNEKKKTKTKTKKTKTKKENSPQRALIFSPPPSSKGEKWEEDVEHVADGLNCSLHIS